MKIVVFGATGMIGQAVMKEAIRSEEISSITVIGRSPSMFLEQKVKELIVPDLFDLSSIESDLTPFDACYSAWVCRLLFLMKKLTRI